MSSGPCAPFPPRSPSPRRSTPFRTPPWPTRSSSRCPASWTPPQPGRCARLFDEVSRSPAALVADLSALTFCSTAALGLLLATTAAAERLGVRWVLVGGQRAVRRPITAAGLDAALRPRDDVASTLTALALPGQRGADPLG